MTRRPLSRLPHWLSGNRFLKIDLTSEEYGKENTDKFVDSEDEANCISSLRPNGNHVVLLDLDIQHYYVRSTTPNHAHLYINHNLSTVQYSLLLYTLQYFGIIQTGYARASIKRGYSALRLPWVKKEVPPF